MAKQTKTIGTGITAREVTSYDGEDAVEAFVRFAHQAKAALSEGGGQFGAYVLETERKCRRILAAAGAGPFEADSNADYAKRILTMIEMTRTCIARGDADKAARMAVVVGHLCTEFRMKVSWESHALRGKKNFLVLRDARLAGNKGRIFNAEHHRDSWQAWADEIWLTKPHLSKSEVAKIIAKKHGGNANTIRRKISQDYEGMNWFRLTKLTER